MVIARKQLTFSKHLSCQLGTFFSLVLFFNIFIHDFGKNIKVVFVKFANDRKSRGILVFSLIKLGSRKIWPAIKQGQL